VRWTPLLLFAWLPAAPVRAQASPDLLADLERNRATVLAYISAMPDSATGFRPTPGVRTFAQQFDHIVSTNLDVAAIALRGLKAAPVLGDSTRYLHDKAALRQATAAQLRKPVAMYGQPPQPAARLAQLTFEHSVWTLGQLVPYLRLNGVTPPEYKMPF
jgi:hypothetical protein